MQTFRREVYYKLLFLSFFRDNLIIHPKGKFRLVWDIIALCLIFFDLFYVPYQLGFGTDENGFLYYFVMAKDLYFFMDLFVNFMTSYYDRAGNLVSKPKLIIQNYLKSPWFLFDLVTALPIPLIVDLALDDSDSSNNVNIVKFLRFVRFVRLIRVLKALKIMRIFNKVEEYFYSSFYNGLKSILSIFFYIVLFAHWMGCLFHFVGSVDLDETGTSWLKLYDLDQQPLPDRYIATFYWSITTMITVGYGDITPQTTIERIIAILAMLSGCAMFAYSMNTIGILVQNLNAKASKTRQLHHSITKYMDEKNVSKTLRNKIMQYLEYMAESEKQSKDAEELIFNALSTNLRNELKKDINGQVLRDNLLFQSTFGSTFRSALSYYLEEQTFSPGEIIFDDNDKHYSMYFLATGTVEIFISKSRIGLNQLERGAHFGEFSFFTGQERTAAARSINFTHVFHLKKELFLALLEDYPYEKETFHMIKDNINILSYYGNLKMKCSICDQEGHYAKYCFRVHYVPDVEKVLHDYRNTRKNFMENFKRNTTRRRFRAVMGKKLLALRIRDLMRDNPQEVRKFLQTDYFKSTSLVNKPKQKDGFLKPAAMMGRRRSRTLVEVLPLTQNLASPSPAEDIPLTGDPIEKIERKALVSDHKNRLILNLRTQTIAPKDQDKEGEESSQSSSESEQIVSPKHEDKTLHHRSSIGKLYLHTPKGSKTNVTFDLVEQVKDSLDKLDTLNIRGMTRQSLENDDLIMDMVMTYQVYFPHNNVKRVLEVINEPEKAKRKFGKYGDSAKKLDISYNRSNTDSILKKFVRIPSRTKKNRVKSLFIMSRYSIWKDNKRKSKGGFWNGVNPFGIIASKNQAIAGMVPSVIMINGAPALRGRRKSRSLGCLDLKPLIQVQDINASAENLNDVKDSHTSSNDNGDSEGRYDQMKDDNVVQDFPSQAFTVSRSKARHRTEC